MKTQKIRQPTAYERKLIGIVRRLPSERVAQVIDFAEFLESRMTRLYADERPAEDESAEEIAAADARWDALFATDESQRLLEQMADDALADIRVGLARPMVFAADGEIAPE